MCPKRIFRSVGRIFSGIFGGGQNRQLAMVQPQRIQAPPPLKPTQPLRDVPTPQDLKKDYEEADLIVGKKRKQLEVEKVKSGVAGQFGAIDPGINLEAPTQGIPKPTT
tara:strand:- start:74 stop:397 length:324 start_codon:yes stop_codon:yes gene_type:complete